MIYLYAMDILRLEPTLDSYRGMVPESRLYQLSVLPQREQQLGLAAELLIQRAVRRHCREMPLPVSRDKAPAGLPLQSVPLRRVGSLRCGGCPCGRGHSAAAAGHRQN